MSPDQYERNRERRSGIDRRQFSYAIHIPERRENGERRQDKRKAATRQVDAPVLSDLAPAWKRPFSI
jgi:hypothetical protein